MPHHDKEEHQTQASKLDCQRLDSLEQEVRILRCEVECMRLDKICTENALGCGGARSEGPKKIMEHEMPPMTILTIVQTPGPIHQMPQKFALQDARSDVKKPNQCPPMDKRKETGQKQKEGEKFYFG